MRQGSGNGFKILGAIYFRLQKRNSPVAIKKPSGACAGLFSLAIRGGCFSTAIVFVICFTILNSPKFLFGRISPHKSVN